MIGSLAYVEAVAAIGDPGPILKLSKKPIILPPPFLCRKPAIEFLMIANSDLSRKFAFSV